MARPNSPAFGDGARWAGPIGRRARLISRGDQTVFFTRPISGAFIVLSLLILVVMVLPAIREKKAPAHEGGTG